MKDLYSKKFKGWIGSKESAKQLHDQNVVTDNTIVSKDLLWDEKIFGKPRKVTVTVTVKIEDAK